MKKITLLLFVLLTCTISKLYATPVFCATVVSKNPDISTLKFRIHSIPAEIGASVAINCGMTEAQVISSGAVSLSFDGSNYYIGYRQVTADNQDPIILKYTNGILDWCRQDYETTGDDGKGYGLFWSGTDLYAVFSATGTQAGLNYTRFTTSGWLTSYGQGGGARVAIILKINTTTGEGILNNGTYIKSVLSNGNANTLVVNDMYLNSDNNLVVRADSWFSPLKTDRTRMTQIGTGGSPHDYTIIFTPNLQTAVCASAVGWDNGTGIDCITIPPTSCAISAITAGTQTGCDITTNKYTQEVTLNYTDAPSSGNLVVNGQNFPITSSPQTVVLTNLDSDRNPVDVIASFSTVPSCNFTQNALFTAPASCSDDVLNINQSSVYNSIQAAVDDANANEVIQILANRRYEEDVVITKNLTFTSSATTTNYNQIEIDQIRVENGNTLTIEGKMSVLELIHLEPTGQLIIDTNAEFALRSTPTTTAMVINDSPTNTIQGNVIVERYLPSTTDLTGYSGIGYRMLSSPFVQLPFTQLSDDMNLVLNTAFNTAVEPSYTVPFPTLYEYVESTAGTGGGSIYNGFTKGYKVPTTANFEIAKGYEANSVAETTVDTKGELNNGNISINITNNGLASPSGGFNLVGNPYPSPIKWNEVFNLSTGVADAVYIDVPTSQYGANFASFVAGVGVNGGTNTIAAMQGFFVYCDNPAGGTINFTNDVRSQVYEEVRFLKTTQEEQLKEGLIKLAIEKNGKLDETAIYFQKGATSAFDKSYDALKLYRTNSSLATLYSYNKENDKEDYFAINGLNAFDKTLQIPLAINVVEAGKHTLSVREIKYFHSLSELYLYDSLTQTLHNLKEEKEYEFLTEKGNHTKRFVLLFKRPTTLAFSEQNQLVVYPNPTSESISYSLKTDKTRAYQIQLIDALGRTVWQTTQEKQGAFLEGKIEMNNCSKGIYLLQISDKNKTIIKRLIKE